LPDVLQVLEVTRSANARELQPVASAGAGLAFQPFALLTVVTYYYSVGIYGSQDIEAEMRRDAPFRQLCDGEFPDWRLLRRFRRLNHEVIHECLARLLTKTAHAKFVRQTEHALALLQQTRDALASVNEPELHRSSYEAENRIAQAMFIDSMAEDD